MRKMEEKRKIGEERQTETPDARLRQLTTYNLPPNSNVLSET